MYNLSASQLNDLCNVLKESMQPYYIGISDYLSDLYETGCRPNELIQMWRWAPQAVGADFIQLQPEKRNMFRYIPTAGLSSSFLNAYNNGTQPYNFISLRQIRISMKLINPAGVMKVGSKGVGLYIYRYNRVNNLLVLGKTWPEIQIEFGWYSAEMSYSYASRIVKVTNAPPW